MRLPFFRDKAPAQQPATGDAAVQAARTAARRRLVGALVLLLIGVVGFPLLFETQPRPLPADLPILVPEGSAAKPAAATRPQPARPAPAVPLPADAGAEPVVAAASVPAPLAATSPAPASAPSPAPASAAAAKPAAAPAPTPKPAATAAPTPKPAATATAASAPAAAGRFVVQVGAYNEAERLKAARQRVETLGFKTYTQDVETATGKRTRVRVGPFSSRQEAEAAAGKLKAAGMQANILSL
jgi:DedD protein